MVLDGAQVEVTLAKPVDKDTYLRSPKLNRPCSMPAFYVPVDQYGSILPCYPGYFSPPRCVKTCKTRPFTLVSLSHHYSDNMGYNVPLHVSASGPAQVHDEEQYGCLCQCSCSPWSTSWAWSWATAHARRGCVLPSSLQPRPSLYVLSCC